MAFAHRLGEPKEADATQIPPIKAANSTSRIALLCLGPNTRRLTFTEKFEMDHIGVAADGAVFDIHLFAAAGSVQRDDDLFAAGGAGV